MRWRGRALRPSTERSRRPPSPWRLISQVLQPNEMPSLMQQRMRRRERRVTAYSAIGPLAVLVFLP